MRRVIFPILLIIVLLSAFGWWWYQPDRVVARRVSGLFQSANVAADSGTITRGLRGNAIEGYLGPDIIFEAPRRQADEFDGPQSRDTVVAMYTSLAKYCRQVVLQRPEIDDISIDGETATVQARIDALIELPNAYTPVDGIQHMTMEWRKIDRKWCLVRAKWNETRR